MGVKTSRREALRAMRHLTPPGPAGGIGWALVIIGGAVSASGVMGVAAGLAPSWSNWMVLVGAIGIAAGWCTLIRLVNGALHLAFADRPEWLQRTAEGMITVGFGCAGGLLVADLAESVASFDGWVASTLALALSALIFEVQAAALRIWATGNGRRQLAFEWLELTDEVVPDDAWVADAEGGSEFRRLREAIGEPTTGLPATMIERLPGPVPLFVVYRRGHSLQRVGVGSVLAQTVAGAEPDRDMVLALEDCRVGERELRLGELMDLIDRLKHVRQGEPLPA